MRRALRAAKAVARDSCLPRWLRGLLLLGIAPWPGPLDEVILAVGLLLLAVGHRRVLREAWAEAAA